MILPFALAKFRRERFDGFRSWAGELTHSLAGSAQRMPSQRFSLPGNSYVSFSWCDGTLRCPEAHALRPGKRISGLSARIRKAPRGLSLIEVSVASFLFLLAALGLGLSLIYADRAALLSALQLSAAHVLQGQIERIRAMPYDAVSRENLPDIAAGTAGTIYLDAERRVPATVHFDVLTTFAVQSATARSVTVRSASIPSSMLRPDGRFAVNELAGNILLVESGRGSTQRGFITGNTAYTISFTADESGKTQSSWEITPDTSSVVQVNMGKIATVRVSWSLRGHQFSEEMRTLVVLPPELSGL